MWRKRRMATPGLGHMPFNPIHGEQANLRQEGTSPFCAMMQIAAEDAIANYVICRGFDTRILKFVDYADGDPNKPGISVAKPFGKRRTGTYTIGEIYPALLPTQGNSDFTDFRQVTYVPPSPVGVNWRVGQNPGVVTGAADGGQPSSLSDTIEPLYDDNGKAINWLLVDSQPIVEPESVSITVLTAIRVDGATLKLQYKSRTVTVPAAGVESDWTDFHTGTECPP